MRVTCGGVQVSPSPARCGRATQKRPPAIFLGCNIFEDGAAAESTIIFALVPPPPAAAGWRGADPTVPW